MTLDLEVDEVEVRVLTSLASVTEITAENLSFYVKARHKERPSQETSRNL
jgi:hypothetical protein